MQESNTEPRSRSHDATTPDDDAAGADEPPREPAIPSGTHVEIRDDTAAGVDAPLLRRLACRAVNEAAGGLGGEVRVSIVGDDRMAALHDRHHGDPSTTDVLTFDLRDAPGGPLDADVVVCADEARRSAGLRGVAVEHELALYILHAALHCLGYDDRTEPGAAAMHAREDEVLRRIGVGPVYAAGRLGGAP